VRLAKGETVLEGASVVLMAPIPQPRAETATSEAVSPSAPVAASEIAETTGPSVVLPSPIWSLPPATGLNDHQSLRRDTVDAAPEIVTLVTPSGLPPSGPDVPEPSTWLLFALGLSVLLCARLGRHHIHRPNLHSPRVQAHNADRGRADVQPLNMVDRHP
jgi:hypothetical protein